MREKQQTVSLDAENAVIGALLIDESILKDLLFAVRESDFRLDMNRRIFAAARNLFLRARPVNAFALRDSVGKDAGEYMAQLVEITPSSANWREYAGMMREQAAMRRMQGLAMQIIDAGSAEECRMLTAQLQQVQGGGEQITAYDMSALMIDFHARQTDETPVKYIETGFAEIDEDTYIQRGDMVIIGGRPSDGKTLLALQMARHMAREWKVGFFSLETDRHKIGDRLVASMANIDFGAIKRRALSEEDWARFAQQGGEAERLNFRVFEASGSSAGEIIRCAQALELDAVFIDYVQLIRPDDRRAMRSEQIAEISRTLHTFAQSGRKTLVVALAQLSRPERGGRKAAQQEDGEEPYYGEATMFDLKESGQLEQDADLILLLSKPDKKKGYDPKRQRRLRIAKNKEGRTSSFMLFLDGAHQSFVPMTDETERDRAYEQKVMEQKARSERMSGAKRR